jgi:hypothetical protein
MPIKTIAFATIPLLLLLVVSNTVTSAQTTAAVTTAAATTKTYEDSQYGFRIQYPANWYIAPVNI